MMALSETEIKSEALDAEEDNQDLEAELKSEYSRDSEIIHNETKIKSESEDFTHLSGRKQLYINLANSNTFSGYDQTAGRYNKVFNSLSFGNQMGGALYVKLINQDFKDRMLESRINIKEENPETFVNFYGKHIRKIENIEGLLECKIEEHGADAAIENKVEKKQKRGYFKQKSGKNDKQKKKDKSSHSEKYSVLTPITNNKYRCHICYQNFAEQQILENHAALHISRGKNVNGQIIYNCAFCPYTPNELCNLKQHTKVKHTPEDEMEIFKCNFCSYRTNNIRCMHGHLKTHDDPLKCEKFKCNLCSFETKNKSCLRSHKKCKHPDNDSILKCQHCSYQTYVQPYLKSHIKSQHNDKKIIYKCNDCAYEAALKGNLRYHIRLMHKRQDEIKMWKCPECSFQTKHKGNLNKHYLVKHEVSEEADKFRECHKCPHCDFRSHHKGRVLNHVVLHNSEEEINWFSCNICSFKSKSKSGVKNHVLTHKSIQELSETYTCHLCIYEAKTKTALQSHLERHKSLPEVKTFDCPKCTYKTRYSGHLKIHMLVHNPEQFELLKCKDCSFKTRNRCTMIGHIRRVHNNDKAVFFKCDECSYKSVKKESLKFHLLQHKRCVDVEWFMCAHCSYETKYKGHLVGHLKKYCHKFELF